MSEQHDERIMRAIRRSDACTNAATELLDAKELPAEIYNDIRRWVVPMLEAEADRLSEEVYRNC